MSFLKKSYSTHDVSERVVHEVLASIDSPRSLAAWLLFESGEHQQLLDLSISPTNYVGSDRFADDYLATKLLSKYPCLKTGIDTKAVAVRSFIDAELKCYDTNAEWLDPDWARFPEILEARKIIHHILRKFEARELASCPEPSSADILSYAFDNGSWGPGVTSSVRGTALSSYHKLAGKKQATLGLIRSILPLKVGEIPCWETSGMPSVISDVTPTHGNRISFVPKNAKTDRIIAIEPHLNVFVQKGLGDCLRKALRLSGLNLNSQERNQRLAREGSLTGALSTIDMKSASDTISYRVVRTLLPFNWFEALNTARSQKYTCDFYDRPRNYEKFSSMGNAATFELESLIFWALNLACHRLSGEEFSQRNLAVFGDDIIAYTSISGRLIQVLNYCGFDVNPSKTFTSGPFRESCGEEFFMGSRVSPFYIRNSVCHITDLYKIANRVQTYSFDRGGRICRDKRFLPVWKFLYLAAPKNLRFRNPHGWGDTGFNGDFDESASAITVKYNRNHQKLTYHFGELIFSQKMGCKKDPQYAVPSALLDMQGGEDVNPYTQASRQPIDRTQFSHRGRGVYRNRRAVSDYWTSLGPWVDLS